MNQVSHIESKTLYGVGNSLIAGQTNNITCNLETIFGQTWSEVCFKVALLKDIVCDKTKTIQCALDALWNKMSHS